MVHIIQIIIIFYFMSSRVSSTAVTSVASNRPLTHLLQNINSLRYKGERYSVLVIHPFRSHLQNLRRFAITLMFFTIIVHERYKTHPKLWQGVFVQVVKFAIQSKIR